MSSYRGPAKSRTAALPSLLVESADDGASEAKIRGSGHRCCRRQRKQRPAPLFLEEKATDLQDDSADGRTGDAKTQVDVQSASFLDQVFEMVRTGYLPWSEEEPCSVSAGSVSSSRRQSNDKELLDIEKVDYPYFEQNFQPLRLLGRGAFGEVWNCKSRKDGQHYAVK
ncbi:unnamed protein product, partial [Polarella glacialis]